MFYYLLLVTSLPLVLSLIFDYFSQKKEKKEKLNIYLAGGWKFRADIAPIKLQLESKGYNVVSHWMERENGIVTPDDFQHNANMDIKEVIESNILVCIMTDSKYAYRGTFTEIGCALGQNMPIIIVCPGTKTKLSDNKWEFSHYCQYNVFYWHKNIQHSKDIYEAFEFLNLVNHFHKEGLEGEIIDVSSDDDNTSDSDITSSSDESDVTESDITSSSVESEEQ